MARGVGVRTLGDLEKRFMVWEEGEGGEPRLGGRLGREWGRKRGGE